MVDKIKRIYKINLEAKSQERVLIITDGCTDEICEASEKFFEIGKSLGFSCDIIKYKPLSSHGEEPPIEVWKKAGLKITDEIFTRLKRKELVKIDISNPPDIVISITHFSTSHTNFRKLLTKMGTRYASMPLFEKSILKGALDVDYEKMNRLGERIKGVLSKGEEVNIQSPTGTDLRFDIKGREICVDAGILSKKGAFGNLPAGEVFLAPSAGTAKGILIIEAMEKRGLKTSITARIENGSVSELSGEEEGVLRLTNIFSNYPFARNIAEFGIGINKRAKNPLNVLEAEKILGTCHIAFGDNSGFGGNVSVPFHEDYVVFSPTIKIDEMVILEGGVFP